MAADEYLSLFQCLFNDDTLMDWAAVKNIDSTILQATADEWKKNQWTSKGVAGDVSEFRHAKKMVESLIVIKNHRSALACKYVVKELLHEGGMTDMAQPAYVSYCLAARDLVESFVFDLMMAPREAGRSATSTRVVATEDIVKEAITKYEPLQLASAGNFFRGLNLDELGPQNYADALMHYSLMLFGMHPKKKASAPGFTVGATCACCEVSFALSFANGTRVSIENLRRHITSRHPSEDAIGLLKTAEAVQLIQSVKDGS